jgi:tRNA pseudouridine13 synthase
VQGDDKVLDERLKLITEQGVPNYFGQQRFGREARNVEAAREMLTRGTMRREPHNRRSMLLSAARSYLFNRVLAERVRAGHWNRLLPGELVMLEGSRSFFLAYAPTPELQGRLSEHDISPSGPLPGLIKKDAPTGEALAVEQAALTDESELVHGLIDAGVLAARRSLRLIPKDLEWHREEGDLLLEFELPSGAFATTLIAELVHVEAGN